MCSVKDMHVFAKIEELQCHSNKCRRLRHRTSKVYKLHRHGAAEEPVEGAGRCHRGSGGVDGGRGAYAWCGLFVVVVASLLSVLPLR